MFDFMFPVFSYDASLSASKRNPGGGMATKRGSLDKVISERYFFNWVGSFKQVTMPIVLIEPLTVRLGEHYKGDVDTFIEDLKACPAKKVLYCSEMEVARWGPKTFTAIIENVDIVTANTDYQKHLIWTLSNKSCFPYHLCDPIDDELFRPLSKVKRIFSAGRVADFKNTEFLINVFKAVKARFGDKIETAYFGNADMWGEGSPEDFKIEAELKSAVDVYEGGVSRSVLSRLFGESLIYASKTTHDVYSSTHAEILASAVISLGGGHPLFRERPGVSGLTDVESFLNATQTVLEMPENQIRAMQKASRDYILKHCGYEAFHKQLKAILEVVR